MMDDQTRAFGQSSIPTAARVALALRQTGCLPPRHGA